MISNFQIERIKKKTLFKDMNAYAYANALLCFGLAHPGPFGGAFLPQHFGTCASAFELFFPASFRTPDSFTSQISSLVSLRIFFVTIVVRNFL